MQKYDKIITGEYHWKGNLKEYVQRVQVMVMPPVVTVSGEKLNGKVVIQSCLKSLKDGHEQDFASLRVQSVQECFALIVSLLLAVRLYAKMTPANPVYVFHEIKKRVHDVFTGKYDSLIRK